MQVPSREGTDKRHPVNGRQSFTKELVLTGSYQASSVADAIGRGEIS